MLPDVDQIIANIEDRRVDQIASVRRKLNDLLIVMNVLDLVQGTRDPFHYTKLMFFVDHNAYEKQVHGLNAPFFVYTHGAYSKELDQMHHALWSAGALNSTQAIFAELSETGRKHLQTANRITGFETSQQHAIIRAVVDEYAGKSGQELLAEHLTTIVKGRTISAMKAAGQFNEELYSGADFEQFASGLDGLEDAIVLRAFDALAFPETFERGDALEFTEVEYDEPSGAFVPAASAD
ncbi:MAG: hypothetical protein NXI24_09295 [bacterium]|nr:hypothetical protein [bacterium]